MSNGWGKLKDRCLPERISKLAIAILLLLGGVALVVAGFTVLPVIGLILAIPFLAFSFYFFRSHLNDQCEIER
jgi:hypothetical protein